MTRSSVTRSILLAVIAMVPAIAASPARAQAPVQGVPSAELQAFVQSSYIFRFADTMPQALAAPRAADAVAQAGGQIDHVYSTVFRGFSARMSSTAADNMMNANPAIVSYVPDGIVTLVQGAGGKKGAGGTAGQTLPPGIARVGGPADGSGKTAWIIDTGIDLDHPDLNVDTARSKTFITFGAGRRSANDENGHGTHVAGTVAAIDNDADVVGVAAGASVVAVRVLDRQGSGAFSWVIAGLDYIAANAAPGDVVNMSLGGPSSNEVDAAVLAVADAGIRLAIAAGNSSAHAKDFSPARVNHPNVYTVSAVDSRDVFASFSNFGNPPVDFAAPGVGILSLWKNGGTNTISGTSMAAPHAAGVLLLGAITGDGTASSDPDGNPDPIAHR